MNRLEIAVWRITLAAIKLNPIRISVRLRTLALRLYQVWQKNRWPKLKKHCFWLTQQEFWQTFRQSALSAIRASLILKPLRLKSLWLMLEPYSRALKVNKHVIGFSNLPLLRITILRGWVRWHWSSNGPTTLKFTSSRVETGPRRRVWFSRAIGSTLVIRLG